MRVRPTARRSSWREGPGDLGPLAFDYGARTVRFAAGVDEAEAAHILEELASPLAGSARGRIEPPRETVIRP